jgi:hypothetical protein
VGGGTRKRKIVWFVTYFGHHKTRRRGFWGKKRKKEHEFNTPKPHNTHNNKKQPTPRTDTFFFVFGKRFDQMMSTPTPNVQSTFSIPHLTAEPQHTSLLA